ncbi:MAG TPA: VWA domain-containing protein, partial [Pyrinomonadaceae bacterium]|nr:VWA domain-containing protein [Pyrinomonadaceae bacterium]
MFLRRPSLFILWALLLTTTLQVQAQSGRQPAPQASPEQQRDDQERVKVFTEEVRLPVVAFDDYGHFDPTLEMTDVLVLEDGVQQQIRSIRHIPASVLLVLDVDNQITLAKDTKVTREAAMRIISHLHQGDAAAVIQFGNGVRTLQNWTTETEGIPQILRTKISGGKRGRLSEAMVAAANMMKDRPAGSRHVVFITDGIETPGGKVAYTEAVKQLLASQATVHIISYTALVRDAIAGHYKKGPVSGGDGVQRNAKPDAPDPTMSSPDINRTPSFRIATIDTDRAMRRWYKKYSDDTKNNEQRLKSLAEETGGQI